jgi:hypothetical protein
VSGLDIRQLRGGGLAMPKNMIGRMLLTRSASSLVESAKARPTLVSELSLSLLVDTTGERAGVDSNGSGLVFRTMGWEAQQAIAVELSSVHACERRE